MFFVIEASRANRPIKTGVEWYAFRVLQALKVLPEAADHHFRLYANTPLAQGLEVLPSGWEERRLSWPPKYLWTQLRLSAEMWSKPPQALFVPAHVLPRIIPSKTVVTVHDVGFYRYPKLYKPIQNIYHRWSTRDILKRATAIITVSEYSRQELIHFCDADPDKLFVTHLGVDHARYQPLDTEETAPVRRKHKITTPYFLYVGRLEAKKNITLLIEAFHRFKMDQGMSDPHVLVLAGVPGAHYDEIDAMLKRSPVRHQIILTGYLSEGEKVALLSGAIALVHPAWYEGFGLTPLEAMACRCPVLCSRTASLPEVVGVDNALWFDPANAESLTAVMKQIVENEPLRKQLADRGREWVHRYSWEKTAQETLRILTSL